MVFDSFNSMESAVVSRSQYLEADELRFGKAVTVDDLDLFEQSALAALRSP